MQPEPNARLESDPASGHVPVLDGFRGLAVLAVMLYHFAYLAGLPLRSSAAKAVVMATGKGWAGVDLFFVLSGFLITGILLREKGDSNYFRNFYARRVLRIFPLYYGFLYVAFFIVPHFFPLDADSRHVYDLQGWLWAYCGNIEGAVSGRFDFEGGYYQLVHLWSLAVEEHFYFVWPLVVWALGERGLLRAGLFACVAAPVLRSVLLLHHSFVGTVYMLTPCRMDALALGGLVAILIRDPRVLARANRWAPWVLAGAGAFLVGFTLLRLDNWHWLMGSVGYSIIELGGVALLLLCLKRGSLWERALSTPALRTLGKYSYGAYLLHWPLQPTWRRLIFDPLAATGHELMALLIYVVASVGLTLLLAAVVWHTFERPFLSLKRFFKSAGPRPARVSTIA